MQDGFLFVFVRTLFFCPVCLIGPDKRILASERRSRVGITPSSSSPGRKRQLTAVTATSSLPEKRKVERRKVPTKNVVEEEDESMLLAKFIL